MINFKDILYSVNINAVVGSTNIFIRNIDFDSRKIAINDVFVAVQGSVVDGHDYINLAIKQGAMVVVCEKMPHNLNPKVTYVQVESATKALAIMASNFYDIPSRNLKLVGVTGTNGKTTIATLLYQLFKNAGFKVGLLSTVKVMVDDIEYKATHTHKATSIQTVYIMGKEKFSAPADLPHAENHRELIHRLGAPPSRYERVVKTALA